jgi:hypothetical protein
MCLVFKVLPINLINEDRGLSGRCAEPNEKGLRSAFTEFTGERFVGRQIEGVRARTSQAFDE